MVLRLRLHPVPFLLKRICQHHVCVGKILVKCQSLSGEAYDLGPRLSRRHPGEDRSEMRVCHGQTEVRGGERRVPVHCFLEVIDTLLQVGLVSLPQSESALEVELVDLWRDGSRGAKPLALLSGDHYLYSLGDGLREFALQGERIAHLTVVCFGPEMLVGYAADQLSRDPQTIALLRDRTFHDAVHPKLFRDLRYRELRVFKTAHGCVRDHT